MSMSLTYVWVAAWCFVVVAFAPVAARGIYVTGVDMHRCSQHDLALHT